VEAPVSLPVQSHAVGKGKQRAVEPEVEAGPSRKRKRVQSDERGECSKPSKKRIRLRVVGGSGSGGDLILNRDVVCYLLLRVAIY
jgi:hypothetical protein